MKFRVVGSAGSKAKESDSFEYWILRSRLFYKPASLEAIYQINERLIGNVITD